MNNEIGVYIGNEQRSEKPIVFNVFDCNRKQNEFVFAIAGKGRCFHVNQSLPRHYRIVFKSNNWLKLHGMRMRRKPFS